MATAPPAPSSTCDIFCAVIDNFGDIGVCWRLAKGLAARGWQVRLWVDDASALAWMAPEAASDVSGIRLLPWRQPLSDGDLGAAGLAVDPCTLLIEAFGCEIPAEFLAACAVLTGPADGAGPAKQSPVWLNLEYLTAESYAERAHGLPSLVRSGPAEGWTKYFFYPGFSAATGGLLREEGLLDAQASFSRGDWLARLGIAWSGERLVCLFCYEPPALADVLAQFADGGLAGQPVRLLVAAGRAEAAVRGVVGSAAWLSRPNGFGRLAIDYLPLLPQAEFDRLLWAADLNFVRGEDSLVRALWAGRPFVWQLYPQDDGAHDAKLQAFLDRMEFPATLRGFYAAWNRTANGVDALPARLPDTAQAAEWQAAALAARSRLLAQDDLVSQLLGFAAKNR